MEPLQYIRADLQPIVTAGIKNEKNEKNEKKKKKEKKKKNVLDETARIKQLIDDKKEGLLAESAHTKKIVFILYVSRLGHAGQNGSHLLL